MLRRSIAVLIITLATAVSVSAAPILLNTVLTGDPRPNNPDNLRVIVTVAGDTTSNVTSWTVDLDMAAYHPSARLDEFGFNLRGGYTNYAFSNFNLPYSSTGGTLNGSGGSTFLLTLDDPSGNRYDATNVTSLRFNVTKNTGTFSMDDFLLAPTSCSSDSLLGCNQLGVHLQALNGLSGSGVATGNYPPPPPPPTSVPEPASLLLMAAGLGLAARLGSRKA